MQHLCCLGAVLVEVLQKPGKGKYVVRCTMHALNDLQAYAHSWGRGVGSVLASAVFAGALCVEALRILIWICQS